ncbi:MAG: type II toxin-antitoxin system RelE/ParE family toxin [Gammaproteobacteria bacterium HGW-Gammaproteobacteria-4]|nr:MAG: type II toxin-antitoxin system RelE/ParE family toxin [Gammaproteobacteria bacterium HGW-Gammaproteobacteria-4]
MSYTLHRDAERELAHAARFYRREGGRALTARFLDEFEHSVELLIEHPGIGSPTSDDRRWFRSPASRTPSSIGRSIWAS